MKSTMKAPLENCPCNGKSVSNLAAPWILLTLHQQPSLHGYELTRITSQQIEAMGMHINMAGLYRHLKALEQRGVLKSQWDTDGNGPARRTYTLTSDGAACLRNWMETLTTQATLIETFLHQASRLFPEQKQSRFQGFPKPCTCQ
nr:helix-turn-helix transcriptional regulator [uncultured Desulfobulbus sp.]